MRADSAYDTREQCDDAREARARATVHDVNEVVRRRWGYAQG